MVQVMVVGVGGFIGAVLRYLVSGWVHENAPAALLPIGTLAVNVLGCLAIGTFMGLQDTRHFMTPAVRMFVSLGLLGAFTTFSTFGYETIVLLRDGEMMRAAVNVGLQLSLGFGAVWLGLSLARAV